VIVECKWQDLSLVKLPILGEGDLLILMPYKNSISIMTRLGTHLVFARHDGTDENGDADMLTMLCLMRFNKGESNEET
jgi:hypothetical protein